MKNTGSILSTLTEIEVALQQFLTRRVDCSYTAADIFQKVAEKLLSNPPRSPIKNHQAYLYQIARNEVTNHYRAEHKRNQYEAGYALTEGELDHRDAERIALANEGLRVLNSALDELPQLTRKIFILYRVDGIKQQAVASQLGVNLSTVEKRLASAMKHCRSRMREEDIYKFSDSKKSPKKA